MATDYYAILGLTRDADDAAIKKAYRELARKLHPDVNKEEDAAARFNEVQEAYDVLSDSEKRSMYDRYGSAAGPGDGGFGWSGTSTGHTGGASEYGDFSSVFEQFFGGGGGGGGSPFGAAPQGTRARTGPTQGEHHKHAITVGFMTAALGGTYSLQLTRGGKVESIDVKIPPGFEPDGRLRVKGHGQPSGNSGKAGDLILTVHVADHPYFRRSGLDVLIDLPVSIVEATLGGTITVPLLKGSVDLKIPPGTSSGKQLRVRGQGVAGKGGKRGDFRVVVQIEAPVDLDEAGRALVEQLGEVVKNPRQGPPWTDD